MSLINAKVDRNTYVRRMRNMYAPIFLTLHTIYEQFMLGHTQRNPHRKFLEACLKKIIEQEEELAKFMEEKIEEYGVQSYIHQHKTDDDE